MGPFREPAAQRVDLGHALGRQRRFSAGVEDDQDAVGVLPRKFTAQDLGGPARFRGRGQRGLVTGARAQVQQRQPEDEQ